MHVTGKPRFTYGANGPFIKNKEKIKKLKKKHEIQLIFITTN